jgi:hypothetical protein
VCDCRFESGTTSYSPPETTGDGIVARGFYWKI